MAKFDLVVIGAGPGGYPAALRAVELGAKSVALVEKDEVGGTCLNRGCIPAKSLILAANLLTKIRDAGRFGIRVGETSVDFPSLMAHKNGVIEQIRGGLEGHIEGKGIKVFRGKASFETRNRIKIVSGRGQKAETRFLDARKVVIATGSVPALPGFLPRDRRIVDSTGFMNMKSLPGRIVVLGGGYIGCELACMAAQLGSKVTIVEMLDDVLVQFDSDIRRVLRKSFESRAGIRILTGASLGKVSVGTKALACKVGDESIEADLLLVSVGRRPCTEGLNLKAAGLELNEKGFVPADEYCRTASPDIFAVGDVTGSVQLAHAATAQGVVAAGNALGQTRRKVETVIPSAIFTNPEAGSVGLSEAQAAEKGIKTAVGKYHFKGLGRAVAVGETEGFAKLIAESDTGRIIGAAVVGPDASDLIAEAAMAIRNEFTAEEIRDTVHAHPTLNEIWLEAAHGM